MTAIAGKCVWVTGASSGIGRCLAQELVEQGCFVIASGRNEAALGELSLACQGRLKPLIFDVAGNEESLNLVRANLMKMTDYLDVVVCCAGVCEYENDLSFNLSMYEKVLSTNFLGVVRTLNLAAPLFKRSEFTPHFVALGSLSSVVGFPRAQAYGASKAAVEYFMRALKADTVNLPMHVSLVRPGFVSTPMTKSNDFFMPFLMSPEAAAKRIVRGIEKNTFCIDFPLRLSFVLRFFSVFSSVWFRLLAPKLTRNTNKTWFKKI